jgi:hypothetical protein
MTSRLLPVSLLLALTSTFCTSCTTVREGPGSTPDPNARGEIRGVEPKPAPIPQKAVPEGESSLRHNRPDQRIDRPNG